MKYLALCFIIVMAAANGQTKKNAPAPNWTTDSSTHRSIYCDDPGTNCAVSGKNFIVASDPAPMMTFTESVDKGIYKAVFEDDGNKWRCYLTSDRDFDPTNPIYGVGPYAVTIVCVKPHYVPAKKDKP